ncbi:hypothetical protein [Terrimonas alba]|uniref:hypothetical protein n=1 Tax=Terrimonas alba TaxID=3349636 RepID=UPI0035F23F8C
MSLNELKKELVSYIQSSNDEEILSLLKEDLVFYGTIKDADITDNLTEEQLKELKALSKEDEQKDTMTQEEFKQATSQWRTK